MNDVSQNEFYFFALQKRKEILQLFSFVLGYYDLMKAKKKTIERDCLKDLMRYHS